MSEMKHRKSRKWDSAERKLKKWDDVHYHRPRRKFCNGGFVRTLGFDKTIEMFNISGIKAEKFSNAMKLVGLPAAAIAGDCVGDEKGRLYDLIMKYFV